MRCALTSDDWPRQSIQASVFVAWVVVTTFVQLIALLYYYRQLRQCDALTGFTVFFVVVVVTQSSLVALQNSAWVYEE